MISARRKKSKTGIKKWQERDIAWIIVYIESNEQIMVSRQKQRKKRKRQRNKIQTQTEYRDILSPQRQYDRPIPPLFPPFYTLFIPMSHWMQLMEDRSAKLPRGFSACGVGRKPPRRRQWPSIPFPSSPPQPVSSFPTAAVSHSLHLSDSLDLRERIVRRWWFEVAIERGMRVEEGVRHSFWPQDLEANFREHWPDSFPSRPLPPRSFSSFSFSRASGFPRSPTFFFPEEEDYCWKEAQKIQPLTDRRIVFARRIRGEKWSEERKKMKRRQGLRFRIPGLERFESIIIRFWASIVRRSTIRSYIDSCRPIIVLHIMFRMTVSIVHFVGFIRFDENRGIILTWQLVAWYSYRYRETKER